MTKFGGIVLTVLILASCVSKPKVERAWWVDYKASPMSRTYQGVDLTLFGGDLKRVVLLNCLSGSRTFTPEQCGELSEYSVAFSATGDFNQDSTPDVARVGAAITNDGKKAAVLFIGPASSPEAHQPLVVLGEHFSALTNNRHLSWFFCMACDFGADVQWNELEQAYELVWIQSDV